MKRMETSIKALDKNTRYFHSHFNSMKQINSIRRIIDDNINIFSSYKSIEQVMVTHFEGQFSAQETYLWS